MCFRFGVTLHFIFQSRPSCETYSKEKQKRTQSSGDCKFVTVTGIKAVLCLAQREGNPDTVYLG